MTSSPQHVVLLGDSIFENALYVPRRPAVIEQLRERLPDWKATLLAVDGAMTTDVIRQLKVLPEDATHLVVSVGGNDALSSGALLYDVTSTAAEGFDRLAMVQKQFRRDYREMLDASRRTNRRLIACTVYDACPELPASAVSGLSVFNDIILRECFRRAIPVIDLRLVCDATEDFSGMSPIEPSEIGGSKIARAIRRTLLTHNFSSTDSVVYGAA